MLSLILALGLYQVPVLETASEMTEGNNSAVKDAFYCYFNKEISNT